MALEASSFISEVREIVERTVPDKTKENRTFLVCIDHCSLKVFSLNLFKHSFIMGFINYTNLFAIDFHN